MNRHFMKPALGLVLAFAFASASTPSRAADPVPRRYGVSVDSTLEMTTARSQTPLSVKATAEFDYALSPLPKGRVETRIDGLAVSTSLNGQPGQNSRMSRSGFSLTTPQETQKFTYDDAPPALKAILAQFGEPLAVYSLGTEGEEIAPPELKIKSGVLIDTNAHMLTRVFHPRFPRREAKWVVATAIPIGQGQTSKGNLTYEKLSRPAADGSVRVKVSGTLEVSGMLGQSRIDKGSYVVSGEQTYNMKVGDWTSGKLDMQLSIEAEDPRSGKITGKGPVTITLKSRP